MNLQLYISSKDQEKASFAESLVRSVLKEGGANLFSLSIVDVDLDPKSVDADNVSHIPTVVISQDKEIYPLTGDQGLDEGFLRRVLGIPLND